MKLPLLPLNSICYFYLISYIYSKTGEKWCHHWSKLYIKNMNFLYGFLLVVFENLIWSFTFNGSSIVPSAKKYYFCLSIAISLSFLFGLAQSKKCVLPCLVIFKPFQVFFTFLVWNECRKRWHKFHHSEARTGVLFGHFHYPTGKSFHWTS